MRYFRKILYATIGLCDDHEGLKQALSLCRTNDAPLTILLVYPKLPESREEYQEKFCDFMRQQTEDAVQAAQAALSLADGVVPVRIEMMSDHMPQAISIIRHVLREDHDLLIKEAEPLEEPKGFKALDMTLLRKCPCPVWLARPISRPSREIRVAVAINPENRDQAEHDISLRMLNLARSLADVCSGELEIVSCWNFEFERYLRRSYQANVPDKNIQGALDYARSSHHAGLKELIHASGVGGTTHVHRLKGQAEECIPAFVRAKDVDILVMGSLARTGIKGFIMGNTAENIMKELPCALVALKPSGFVSPIRAY
ncbi:MAG: universal stress protein [Desulfobulbus sp.]|nr:universal stress protein [Desulfobulbus sp.]